MRRSTILLDEGEKPAVISAIMKQQTTERARNVINGGMDILGGGGICLGDNNFLAGNYTQAPIGITVEGSNTLTRSLIIFGQGLMRSHPYLLNITESIEENDKKYKIFYGMSNKTSSEKNYDEVSLNRQMIHLVIWPFELLS